MVGHFGRPGDPFLSAHLGDERRSRRACDIANALGKDPGQTFPKIFWRKAALEGFYRLVNNRAVSHEPLIDAVAEATAARAGAEGQILAIHDTTAFTFDPRVVGGIGRLSHKNYGFLGHFALAVSADGERRPLGVLGMLPVVRGNKRRGKLKTEELARIPADEKESRRWPDLMEMVEGRISGFAQVIHVADREADTYPILSHMSERGLRFVVRVGRDRAVLGGEGEPSSLRKALNHAPVLMKRTLPISGRRATYFKYGLPRRPTRTERDAELAVTSVAMTLPQARHWRGKTAAEVRTNIVWVRELNPPEGEEAVDWVLATTEPIKTAADLERVVDIYRARWLIEEFFKALKTGCQYEKRQLESIEALLVTLALLIPVASHLLELRAAVRTNPNTPAVKVLGETRIAVLRGLETDHRLPRKPSVRDALLAIASLGGHLKQNGEPGWQVLARGMEDLLKAESVWEAALRSVGKM